MLCGLVFGTPRAAAHTGTAAAVAADYEARLDGVRPTTMQGVRVGVVAGDIKLSLSVDPGRTVVVLGLVGEPFLRFADDTVDVNERSPTAAEIRLVALQTGSSLRPRWALVRRGRSFAWHESRLRPLLSHRTGRVASISIPLRIDGRVASIVGASWHANPPPVWPWIITGLLPVVLVGLAARIRPARLGLITAPLAAIAIALTVLCVVGRTLEPPYSRTDAAVQIGAAGALGALALFALIRVRAVTRPLVAAAIGAIVALYAAGSLSVIVHGFVLSRLPADVDRAGTMLSLAIGICLVGVEVMSWMSPRVDPGSVPAGGRKRSR